VLVLALCLVLSVLTTVIFLVLFAFVVLAYVFFSTIGPKPMCWGPQTTGTDGNDIGIGDYVCDISHPYHAKVQNSRSSGRFMQLSRQIDKMLLLHNCGRPMEYGRPLYFYRGFFFYLSIYLSIFYLFPRLISVVADWMSSILPLIECEFTVQV